MFEDLNENCKIDAAKKRLSSLYDSKGRLIDFSSYEYLSDANIGQCSSIFVDKAKTQVIKMYHLNCEEKYRISVKMFEKFKCLDIPNVVPLNGYYFYDAPTGLFKVIDAYSMKYLNGENISLFSLSYEEFMELIEMLEETLTALSCERIIIGDLNYTNILFFKDSVYLIDLDCYRDKLLSKKMVYYYNKCKLIRCINNILVYQSFRTAGKTISCFIDKQMFKSFSHCVDESLKGNSPKQLCYKIISDEMTF